IYPRTEDGGEGRVAPSPLGTKSRGDQTHVPSPQGQRRVARVAWRRALPARHSIAVLRRTSRRGATRPSPPSHRAVRPVPGGHGGLCPPAPEFPDIGPSFVRHPPSPCNRMMFTTYLHSRLRTARRSSRRTAHP